MRVLRTEGSLSEKWVPRLCTHRGQPYAILSHRWLEDANDEVLFADIEEIDRALRPKPSDTTDEVVQNPQFTGTSPDNKPGFAKLKGAAQQAHKDGYKYIWIDTCCIDKNSSAELSEAINSMWSWYSAASVCFVYLTDVYEDNTNRPTRRFAQSQWWTRGWTLQELLAPQNLTFFSATWTLIGHKQHMDLAISEITGINTNVINGTISLKSISIAQRMSWASSRTTTRLEDVAYCLMGLFGVNMPLLYGEGNNAFLRLQKEIMTESDDETIFAWRDKHVAWRDKHVERHVYTGLLASHPSAFKRSRRVVRYEDDDRRGPYSMTNKGLSIALHLTEAKAPKGLFRASLQCGDTTTNSQIGIFLKKVSATSEQFARVRCHEWSPPASSSAAEVRSIHVKQLFDQHPPIEPLSNTTHHIRLLRLLPSTDTSTIRVRLMEADFRTARYTVVSHSSGDGSDIATIWINSQPFKVPQEVFSFLQKLRSSFQDGLFWINAICIDQQDVPQQNMAERLDQTLLMRQIFTHATRVAIWLGQHETDVAMGRLLKSQDLRERAAALETVAADPYWTNVEILPEILLAPDVIIELPTRRISIRRWKEMYEDATSQFRYRNSDSSKSLIRMGRLLPWMQAREDNESRSRNSNEPGHCFRQAVPRCIDLQTLLEITQFSDCKKRLDRVYALIAITNLFDKVHLDYSEPPLGLFFRVASCLGRAIPLRLLPLLLHALDLRQIESPTVLEAGNSLLRDVFRVRCPGLIRHPSNKGRDTKHLSPKEKNVCLILNAMLKVDSGLVLEKLRNDERYYKPSRLYVFAESEGYSFRILPRKFRNAFKDTRAVIVNATDAGLQLEVTTDRDGLLALGLCTQWPDKVLPPVFDLTED